MSWSEISLILISGVVLGTLIELGILIYKYKVKGEDPLKE